MIQKNLIKTAFLFSLCLFGPTSQPYASTLGFFDHLRSIENLELNVRVFTSDFLGDPAVQDANTSANVTPIVLIPAKGKEDVMALFKLECMDRECSIVANFYLGFSMSGLAYKIEPKLVLQSYSVDPTGSENALLSNEVNQILNRKVFIEGFASYGDDPSRFWIVDNPERMMQQSVNIELEHFSKEQKIEFVKACFNKCDRVRVIGQAMLIHGSHLGIKADEIQRSD